MKDGLRFVDCDMHIMEPVDLLDKYLDKKFRDRVILPVDAQGKLKRGMIVIDGQPTSLDHKLQQHRKRSLPKAKMETSQPLSGSRMAAGGYLNFAIERNYDAEAQGYELLKASGVSVNQRAIVLAAAKQDLKFKEIGRALTSTYPAGPLRDGHPTFLAEMSSETEHSVARAEHWNPSQGTSGTEGPDEIDALIADFRDSEMEEPGFPEKEVYEEHEVWETLVS